MKIFVFNRINQCSCNYHTEGGVVIVADDIDAAKELIKSDEYISITKKEWANVEAFELATVVLPKYWVMPDAGCC
jgi:hypothetical protein